MRVIIDINGITAKIGGLGSYTRLLVSNLAEIDSKNEYLLYLHQWQVPKYEELENILPKQKNFKLVWQRVPNSVSLFLEYKLGLGLTEFFLKNDAETVFHGPGNIVPPLKMIKSVVSIHHYMPTGHPLFHQTARSARNRLYFGITEKAARAATHVVATSENTKKDILEQIGIPAEKVSVIYAGIQPAFRKLDPCALPPALAGKLPGKYVLFTGPLDERKNLPAFLAAFNTVKEKLADYRIAITSGPSSSVAQTLSSLIEKFSLRNNVVFLGEVSDDEMVILFNRAQCLAYPSLLEGFGSPTLEAMACGCPVIASNTSAIPEITAGAALLFDPRDQGAIARSLLKITQDEGLRRDLIARGFERSKRFSWQRMAKEFLDTYRAVLY